MPNKRKYTKQQRIDVYNLYWKDRVSGRQGRGRYTCKDIERLTGVNAHTASKIARGVL